MQANRVAQTIPEPPEKLSLSSQNQAEKNKLAPKRKIRWGLWIVAGLVLIFALDQFIPRVVAPWWLPKTYLNDVRDQREWMLQQADLTKRRGVNNDDLVNCEKKKFLGIYAYKSCLFDSQFTIVNDEAYFTSTFRVLEPSPYLFPPLFLFGVSIDNHPFITSASYDIKFAVYVKGNNIFTDIDASASDGWDWYWVQDPKFGRTAFIENLKLEELK